MGRGRAKDWIDRSKRLYRDAACYGLAGQLLSFGATFTVSSEQAAAIAEVAGDEVPEAARACRLTVMASFSRGHGRRDGLDPRPRECTVRVEKGTFALARGEVCTERFRVDELLGFFGIGGRPRPPAAPSGDADAADLSWWKSMLPPGWTVVGWTGRREATVGPPPSPGGERGRALEISGRFLEDLWGHARAPLGAAAEVREGGAGADVEG